MRALPATGPVWAKAWGRGSRQVQVKDLQLIGRAMGTLRSVSREGEVPTPSLPGHCKRTRSLYSLNLSFPLCEVGGPGINQPTEWCEDQVRLRGAGGRSPTQGRAGGARTGGSRRNRKSIGLESGWALLWAGWGQGGWRLSGTGLHPEVTKMF